MKNPLTPPPRIARNVRIPRPVTPSEVPEAPPSTASPRSVAPPPSPAERAARSERSAAAFRVLRAVVGFALVVGIGITVAWSARRYVKTSPRFAVSEIVTTGSKRHSPEELASIAGIVKGNNVFTTDLDGARARLLADPWVSEATLARQLPGTVYVRVVEREAAGVLGTGDGTYLVTREGEPFKKLEAGDPTDLVVVTGVDPGAFQRDRVGASLQVKRALDVVEDLERAGLAKRWPAQEVHLDKDGSVGVTLGKEAILLQLGQPPFREKIEAGKAVLAEVARRKANASVVFLDNEAHPERVVVRMR